MQSDGVLYVIKTYFDRLSEQSGNWRHTTFLTGNCLVSSSYHDRPLHCMANSIIMSPSPTIQVQILRNQHLGVSDVHINRNSIWNTLCRASFRSYMCTEMCSSLAPRLLPNFLSHTI